ncbi:MAG: hypothetical protein E7477_06380 [Ruminococcaceae bacterium]|nr:hypothetical protein [Oscillospiraceae bacterium]
MCMGFTILSQQLLFFYSIVFGFFLCFVYCIFRIFRNIFSSFDAASFIFDLLYFLFTAVAFVIFIFTVNNGEIRIFILASVLIGWILFFFSFGRLISFLVKKSSEILGKICRKGLK